MNENIEKKRNENQYFFFQEQFVSSSIHIADSITILLK